MDALEKINIPCGHQEVYDSDRNTWNEAVQRGSYHFQEEKTHAKLKRLVSKGVTVELSEDTRRLINLMCRDFGRMFVNGCSKDHFGANGWGVAIEYKAGPEAFYATF